MQNFVPALLRLTARPRYWRIAVILPGHILWRTYSRVEYPTPGEAVRRCLAGLVQPPKHAKQYEQSPTPCQRFAFDFGEYPPESERACHRGPKPEHRLPAIDGDKAMQHGLPPSQPNLNCAAYHTDDKANDKAQDKLKHFPHPLPARLRAAWWGWL